MKITHHTNSINAHQSYKNFPIILRRIGSPTKQLLTQNASTTTMSIMKMTKQHYLFCEAFDGDNITAMKQAGFEGTDRELNKKARDFLQQHIIIEAIRQRSLYRASTTKIIATREERQAFWTSLMRNEDPNQKPEINDKGVTIPPGNLPLPMRLKASELLGKSETDFVERLDMNHNISITDVIKEAYTIPNENMDVIEAQYEEIYRRKKEEKDKPSMVEHEDEFDFDVGDTSAVVSLGDFI